jgi:hypothetical protein
MAEGKYTKYVNKMVSFGKQFGFNHPSFEGKATIGPPAYDRESSGNELVGIHIEYFQINKAGVGLGNFDKFGPDFDGTPWVYDRPHRHFADEYFMFHGSDLERPTYLGAEVEFWLGEGADAEQLIITEASVVLVPAGMVHCPIWFRKVDHPPVYQTVVLTSGFYKREYTDVLPPDFKHIGDASGYKGKIIQ